MSRLKDLKLGLLGAARAAGASARIARSEWRRKRLLILCYHGVSLGEEHEWNPAMFPPREWLERRLELVAERCNVLPLGEAVERLQAETLPERSAVVTFDDGFHDFYVAVRPMLARLGLPATLYWFTEYSELQLPVFDNTCYYLLWKGLGRRLEWPGAFDEPVEITPGRIPELRRRIARRVRSQGLTPAENDTLLAELAGRVGVDYEALRQSRILTLMTPAEAAEAARDGVDLQLHTHRHRVSRQRERFVEEIVENRKRVEAASGRPAEHFCYTAGFTSPEFPGWLRECGVRSATTCEPDLAGPNADPLLLPRLVDAPSVDQREFEAWLSGEASWIPRRSAAAEPDIHQLADDEWLAAMDADRSR